ncbi:MAG: tetratricopeptide repeat protein [Planctomycetes bacterium]|nr:tetratricopeptide repeat protein [Planctomycetota bacterium]
MSAGGRNDPCPCGSGRKAKQCCLRAAGPAVQTPAIVLPGADGMEPRSVPLAEAVRLAQDRQQHGDLAGAEKIYERVLAVDPDHGDALSLLGVINHQMGKPKEAFVWMKQAADKHPKRFNYHFNLGAFCDQVMADDEAVAAFRRALAIDPQPKVWEYLGKLLRQTGELDESIECCRQAIKAQPRNAVAWNNLGATFQRQGKLKEALECFETSLAIKPDFPLAWNNYLYTLNFTADSDPRAIFEAHRKFGTLFDRPMSPRDASEKHSAGAPRRLRVGYVSPDFRRHSVAHFIEPILKAHDPEKIEVFCYSNTPIVDETTLRIKALAPNWRLIHNRPDEEVAELIRRDDIDILVDLAGHTTGNRLPLFGLKPAPVQVSWIGYPNTTGLTTMDFRITDRFADPPGETDALHSETLWRMPDCFSCFQAPPASPEVGPLPALKHGGVTFGSFNNFAKTTPQVIDVWARILKGAPAARLLLKNRSMTAPKVRDSILAMFAGHGVAAERVEMLGTDASPFDHLDRYNAIDVALDPFPYNGTTTTFEALWMGVPVVALAGASHVGRVGVSQMSNLGLTELIARDIDDYVKIAVGLAADLPRLTELRAGLRRRLIASPLMDAARFTRHLERAYQAMWESHFAKAGR